MCIWIIQITYIASAGWVFWWVLLKRYIHVIEYGVVGAQFDLPLLTGSRDSDIFLILSVLEIT